MKPAIVVSGFTMGLGVIRALGAHGVPVILVKYDDTDIGHVSRYVREVVDAPHPAIDEDSFIARLVEVAPRFDRGLLVPASDAALVALARRKIALQRHYVVAATDWSVTRRLIEKSETYALAGALGVPAPRTTVPRNLAEAERYAEAALYPCLVKPSQGHLYKALFGRKMDRAEDRDSLLRAYRAARAAGLQVMLQELIPDPGDGGANYISYMVNGEPLAEFTARKLRGSPPELGSPRVAQSELIPAVIEPGRAILRAMSFEGFACVEFKRDARDGVWKLMEVNGRANLSGSLAVRCGVNFPLLQYRHLLEGEFPQVDGFETGVYWIDLARDLGCIVRYAGRRQHGLRELMEPYRGRRVYAIWDPQDPKPFFVRLRNLARSARSSVLRSITG
jgi:D-aspartate ligase